MNETWIVGINPVEGALVRDAARVSELRVEQGKRNPRVADLVARAGKLGIAVRPVARSELDRIAGKGARHQGIAARYLAPAPLTDADVPGLLRAAGKGALFLVLDGVTDPHNLGACLRSAAAAGVTAVIVPRDRAAGITPAARRAAAGGADRVPFVVATNLARVLRTLKDGGVWLTGLAGDATDVVHDLDFTGPIALVMGGEDEGLRRLTRDTCDFLGRIPMTDGVESLNVSVATGIVLFEAVRQRSKA